MFPFSCKYIGNIPARTERYTGCISVYAVVSQIVVFAGLFMECICIYGFVYKVCVCLPACMHSVCQSTDPFTEYMSICATTAGKFVYPRHCIWNVSPHKYLRTECNPVFIIAYRMYPIAFSLPATVPRTIVRSIDLFLG